MTHESRANQFLYFHWGPEQKELLDITLTFRLYREVSRGDFSMAIWL